MRLLILSDIHANIAALESIREEADAVVFLGDCVGYGPCPAECIAWMRRHAIHAVCGNHDHAVGFDADPRCSAAFRDMALATDGLHRQMLSEGDRDYLRSLPLRWEFDFGGARFYAVHATPANPLHSYLPSAGKDSAWRQQTANLGADFLLVGHTHEPIVREIGGVTLINPGSVGQPKHGDPRAACAIWEDGEVRLRRTPYPVERTVRQLEALSLPPAITQRLAAILRTGEAQ